MQRLSKVQKSILIVLSAAFTKGIKSIESPDLRLTVETINNANVDRSNFQKSLQTLVKSGLVMRENIVHEVWYNITPEGFELALNKRN